MNADPSPPSSAMVMKGYSYTSTPPMGRMACTEPQCMYKGDLYLFFTLYTSLVMIIVFLENVNDSLKTHLFNIAWEVYAECFEKHRILMRQSNINIYTSK